MKQHIIIVLAIWAFSVNLYGEDVDEIIEQANKYYAEGFYQEAIDSYSKIEETKYISADVYYNMGNAYYKMKNLPYAILYYERALTIDRKHEDAKHNLALANAFIMDKTDAIPEVFFVRWKHAVVNIFLPRTWIVISLTSFTVFLVLFLVYFFSTRMVLKKTGFWIATICLFISILSFLNYRERAALINNSDKAIIVAPIVSVKSSPNISGTDVFVLHEGTKVSLEDQVGEWSEIRLSDGNKGWVKDSDFEEI